jgi:hypothetical protein
MNAIPFAAFPPPEGGTLYRLIYASRANPPVDLQGIVGAALRNNPSVGITGGLAYLEGVFLQYLEGTRDAVEHLFSEIHVDARHREVKVLERRTVPRRMFIDWSMAELAWNERTKQIFQSFSPGTVLNLYDTDPTTAAPLFRAWAATDAWLPASRSRPHADDRPMQPSVHLDRPRSGLTGE